MSSAFLVPVMDHMSVCRHFRAKIPILEQIWMKMPERSCTSHAGHFLVLLPQTSLSDVIMWRHNIILWRHMSSHHKQCHLDGTRHLSTVFNYFVMKFTWWLWPMTLTYNPNLAKFKVNPITKIRVRAQMVQSWGCGHTDTKTARFYDLDRWRGR